MAPFRIQKTGFKALAAPSADQDFRSYLDRLIKMIPGEVVALYLVGSGLIPKDESPWWLVGWSLTCLVGVFLIRIYGTADPRLGQPVQWPSVFISASAFVVWVYSLGGPFIAFGLYKPFLGSLLVLAWTFFVPIFYKGD